MSHQIEKMFSVHETPWHKLGAVLDHFPTTEEAWKKSGWNFTVEKIPLFTAEGVQVPNMYVARRTDTNEVLTRGRVLSNQYELVQNMEAFNLFRPLFDSGELLFETMGTLDGGRRVWILARFNDNEREVLPGDPVRSYLLFANGHDGSLAVTLDDTNIRVVCNNTLQAALQASGASRIRHVKGAIDRVADAADVIRASRQIFSDTVEGYKKLASVKVKSTQEVVDYTAAVFGREEKKAQANDRVSGRLEAMMENFESGVGSDIPGVRGTVWGLYNALTEYASHHRPDMDSLMFGSKKKLIKRGFDVALAMAKQVPLEDVFDFDDKGHASLQEVSV